MNNNILQLKNLSYSHSGGQQFIADFNLSIQRGDRLALVGPNGAGKTTLFLLATGMLEPTSGEVWLYDQKLIPSTFNPALGMIFQNQDDQLFSPSVYEDIAFGLKNLGFSPEEIAEKLQEVLYLLGIAHLQDKPPHHLSGGEKRLVAIAGVLAMEPRLIIWDEPTSNLDMRYRRRLIEIINGAKQEAMVIASHDLEFVLEVCNRLVLVDQGKVIIDGDPREILKNEELLSKHGLEVPYSVNR